MLKRYQSFWRILRRMGTQKRRLALSIAGGVIYTACAATGIGAMFTTAYLMLEERLTLPDLIRQHLVESDNAALAWLGDALLPMAPAEPLTGFLFVLSLLLGVVVIGAVGAFIQGHYLFAAIWRFERHLLNDAYRRLIATSVPSLFNLGGHEVINRMTSDLNEVIEAIVILLNKGVRRVMMGLITLIAALYLNVLLTLAVLIVAPPAALLMRWMMRQTRKRFARMQHERGRVIAYVNETVSHLPTVKLETAEPQFRRGFATRSRRLERENRRLNEVRVIAAPIASLLGAIGFALAAAAAAWATLRLGVAPVEFLAVLGLLAVTGRSSQILANLQTRLARGNAAAERISDLLDVPDERPDDRNLPALPRHTQRITFDNVTFTYPRQTNPALREVSLDIPFGATVALVGSNGSGKSTLVKLLTGLLAPTAGRVLIDGRDIAEHNLRSLRKQMSMVPQSAMIFTDTVRRNIACGDSTADDDRIRAAARLARAADFIEQLPDGYDTLLGHGGVELSGGEQQRLCLARALLHDPAILILDEATSQVDVRSESLITATLREQHGRRTSFVIAHRFAAGIDADLILVLDAGRLVDQGTHDELLDRCEAYRSLALPSPRRPVTATGAER